MPAQLLRAGNHTCLGAIGVADPAIPQQDDSFHDRPAMMCYVGKFQSMDGEVEVTEDHLKKVMANHNERLRASSHLPEEQRIRAMPPLQVDHSTSAMMTIGRVIGECYMGQYEPTPGVMVPALFNTKVRTLGRENVEKVRDARWVNVSIGADLEKGVLNELSITPFPAANNAALLSTVHNLSMRGLEEAAEKCGARTFQSLNGEFCAYFDSEADAKSFAKESGGKPYIKHTDKGFEVLVEMKSARLKETELPGHVDEALWEKAKKASQEAFGEIRWPFVSWWYQKEGGKFSQKFSSGKEKPMKEKMKKHLMEKYSMSEKEADEHMKKMSKKLKKMKKLKDDEEADTHMASLKDEDAHHLADDVHEDDKKLKKMEDDVKSHEKNLSALKKHLMDECEMSEKDADEHMKKLAKMSDPDKDGDEHGKGAPNGKMATVKDDTGQKVWMAAAKPKIVELAKGFMTQAKQTSLAVKKETITARLSRLRAEAKITPAEIKKMDLDKMASETDAVVAARFQAYEDREPVIDASIRGTTQAINLAKVKAEAKTAALEAETRNDFGMAKKEGETQLSAGEVGVIPATKEDFGSSMKELERLLDGNTQKTAVLSQVHSMLRMSRVAIDHQADYASTEKQMSALAENVNRLQTQFKDVLKVVSEAAGIDAAELTE